jgi:hypothetical protein
MSVPYISFDEFDVVEGGLDSLGAVDTPFTATIRALKVPPRGYIHAIAGAHLNISEQCAGRKFKLWLFNSLVAADAFCDGTIEPALAAALAADVNNTYFRALRPDTGYLIGPIDWDSSIPEAPGVLNTSGFSEIGYQTWRTYQCADGNLPSISSRNLYAVVACEASGASSSSSAEATESPRIQLAITIDTDS